MWRALPADFPPAGTVYWWAGKWEADGSTARMHDDLRGRVRAAAGRSPAPTAAIIDSQSVKGSEMIARGSRGYDAGKKINDLYLEPFLMIMLVTWGAVLWTVCSTGRSAVWVIMV